MEASFVILAGLILIAGSMLQGAVGFGFGMFAIPLIMLLGAESYQAIAILSICGSVQTISGVISLRKHIHWCQVAWVTAISCAILPLGVITQAAIVDIGRDQVRQVFGGLILAALILQQAWRIRPREHLHLGWGVLAAVLCGFMAGLAGMGGPALVMWVMAHTWTNERSRVTLWSVFLGLTPIQLIFLFHQFGDAVVPAMGSALVLAPITLLGVYPGIWLGNRIPRATLRHLAFGALAAISTWLIISPLVRSLFTGDSM